MANTKDKCELNNQTHLASPLKMEIMEEMTQETSILKKPS